MGGPELAERVKEIRPLTKVLYASGYTDDTVFLRGLLEPGTPFFEKPFLIHSEKSITATISSTPFTFQDSSACLNNCGSSL